MGFVHDREGLGQQGFGNLITGCNKVQRWYNPEKEILEHVCDCFHSYLASYRIAANEK